jgi:hypothetical protein
MSTAVPHRLADAVRARRRLLAGLGAVLLLPASSPRAQGTAACAAVQPVPEGTYVALAGDRMLRLLVESSLEKATLVLNRIEGSQLVDRRYWEPAKGTADCAGVRTIDYLEQGTTGPTLRLVIQVPDRIVREGLPRPVTVLRAELSAAGGLGAALEFEEVVVRRAVGSR